MKLKFADTTENKRYPNPTEEDSGYPCGPADQALFNGQWYQVYKELHDLISFAGITPNSGDLTQVRQAILALLATVSPPEDTGGPDLSGYILMSQARARLPIYPEIQTADGKMGVTSTGAANVRIPAGVNFQHRGIYPYTTVQTDFVTVANKIYHLRWNPTDGFELIDTTDAGYNPTAAIENVAAFDTTFDDMIVARVTTNGSNIPTINNLVNKVKLFAELRVEKTFDTEVLAWAGNGDGGIDLYWSRRPQIAVPALQFFSANSAAPSPGGIIPASAGAAQMVGVRPRTDSPSARSRYGMWAPEVVWQDTTRSPGRYAYTWICAAD